VRGEVSRSGAQLARYLYYLGRLRAVQLDYSEAKDCLQQAARKVRQRRLLTWAWWLPVQAIDA
jgi:hypothetical protein